MVSAAVLSASEKDTIGLTDLLARKPGADGSGLRIAQVEAGTAYQPSPAGAAQPASKFSFYDADSLYPVAGSYNSSKQSGHANLVANNFFDLNTGVATDVSEIFVFDADHFFNGVVSANTQDIGASVVNQSFIFTLNPATQQSTIELVQQRYDNYADKFGILFVNGVNNGSSTAVVPPASSYNCIAVGREDLASSTGTTYDGRSKPDMIAPGSASSYAAPYVAGAAAVLMEAAANSDGGSGTATAAADPRTVKALILNGAVKDFSWTHSSTQPLDTRRGAGMLEINHSHLILEGGKHNSISGSDESSGGVHTPSSSTSGNVASPIGWNFETITDSSFSIFTTRDRVENYYFDHTTVKDVVATLTWNRQLNKTSINNLDLYLFNANTGAVVESSVSAVDNVEHIYSRDLPIGRYVLQVVKRGSGRVSNSEEYALAFRFSEPAPDAPTTLVATTISNNQIDLTWSDNSSDELNFELQRSTLSGRAYNTVFTLAADTTSYSDTSLSGGSKYYYRVKATNANGDSFYSNVVTATTLIYLEDWRQDNFGTTANTGDAANDADPDNDGVNNLTEFALSTDPNSGDGDDGGMTQPKASMVEDGGSTYLQITVNRKEKKPEIDYIVEVKAGLLDATWTPATTVLEDTATTLRVRDNVAIGAGMHRFIRLRVVELP